LSHHLRQLDACLPLAVALALCWSQGAQATTYYWDTNGASAGIGSATTPVSWLTNSWATGSTGTLATGSWPNTEPANADTAVFQGTAGTVSLSAVVNANSLSFLTRDYHVASTGGVLNLSGSVPVIHVSPPSLANSGQQTVRLSAPIVGTNGLTVTGNSLTGGFKFLQLENANSAVPNSFSGTLTIAAGGAVRLGGGVASEQIPDNVDLNVEGVIDFVTSGGASDGKQERVRNVSVTGTSAVFSVGNGSDFVVNSLTGANSTNISVNGNNASVPGKLSITGWQDGQGVLALHSSAVKLNTTGSQAAIGGRIVLGGDVLSTGDSQVVNNNGGGNSTPEWDDNIFTNKAFDFTGNAHTIDVADGTLTFTSRAPSRPLEITTTQPAGAIVTKTGPGTWRLENAVQTSFTGATRIAEGTLRLDRPALADGADLQLQAGTLVDLNFAGTDVIDSLFFDGVSQAAGTWGSLASTATFKSEYFTGTGLLQVTTFVPPPPLYGDYNHDHVVDAADYTVWRDHLDSSATLPNDQTPGDVTLADYDVWNENFGNISGAASGPDGVSSDVVPESDALVLMLLAMGTHAGVGAQRRV
jgi:autotransporter-associated beta strand protein